MWMSLRRAFSFFFNAHNDFFEEIAKYRAACRIWAREMKETFKAENRRSLVIKISYTNCGRFTHGATTGE